jgi:serine/threonine-protein kinase
MDDDVSRFAQARLGQVLRGKYCLERVLGVGGMGAVYAATHRNRKRFAVKMLHPGLSRSEDVCKRFLREGYVANTVSHPGAVTVLDDDVAEDGSAFLVMELLEGKSFEDLWESRGRTLPLPFLLALFDQVLDVLAAAHGHGIVHRDLKPANLFLTNDGQVKVLDFGIARLLDASANQATQTGAMLGTPAFMAPEQARGNSAEVDAQTDLWAVGATLFVLITGRLVHDGRTASELLINAATRPSPSLGSVAPGVPEQLIHLVDRALMFDKKARWSSASEMQHALARGSQDVFGTDVRSLPRPTPAALSETAPMRAPTPIPPEQVESAVVPVVHVTRASKEPAPGAHTATRPTFLLLGALLLAIGVIVLLVFTRPGSEAPVAVETASAAVGSPSAVQSAEKAHPDQRAGSVASGLPRAGNAMRPAVRKPSAPSGVSTLCGRFLERQSLGETLSPPDQAAFSQHCQK